MNRSGRRRKIQMRIMKKEDLRTEFISQLEANQDIIHKICHLYADSQEEKKDLKQDIIYQLWKSYASFRKQAKFTTWMYRVALNTALLNLRSKIKVDNTVALEQRHELIPDNPFDEAEHKVRMLYRAIGSLKEMDRALIFLYLERCPYQKISEIMGISEKNVSVRLTRIRENLRKRLTEKGKF
jgi:RNA polymerase sigma-70 factor (ECF subfamily)